MRVVGDSMVSHWLEKKVRVKVQRRRSIQNSEEKKDEWKETMHMCNNEDTVNCV